MNLTVAKFGGSAIGPDGMFIPDILSRIDELRRDGKVIAVFSAPLATYDGMTHSLTDIILEQGQAAQGGTEPVLDAARSVWQKIAAHSRIDCSRAIDEHLARAQGALDAAYSKRKFADETRSQALAFSGEILMSHVMDHILRGNNIKSAAVQYDDWPIITDENIESTNFLASESRQRMQKTEQLVQDNEVVAIGGFIGRTISGTTTTYERGGSDRTAADLGILFDKKYDTVIDLEKDSAVVSADPKIVNSGLVEVDQLSYNEARLAGMFGMKILDPIAIKEILENGIDIPITITNMREPQKRTIIKRKPDAQKDRPIKIVTGKKNCAILRIEAGLVQRLLASLDADKRYSEFVILSPFTRDGTGFSRILFLDADYVKRNEKYFLGFDPLAAITYNRGVITLIGDQMWKVQQVVSRISAKVGGAGLNILNMDAQEETSRIIIVVEDAGQNITKAISSIHQEISNII